MSSLAIFYLPRYSLPLGYSFVLLTVGDSIGSAINFSTSFFEFSKMTWPLKVRIFQKIFERHHIATHSLSSPITSETVPLKFPGNFQKFPKKLEALLLVAQLGTGNFYRF